MDITARIPRRFARWTRILALSSVTGIVSGLAAAALEYGLHEGTTHLVGKFTHLGHAGILEFRWAILLLPAFGGLFAGLVRRWLSPSAGGHGTDMLIGAFHRRGGDLPLRGPGVNAATAAVVISCGGSAGPEGPIAALGAAIGSSLGRLFSLTPRERRIMLVAGCGAGVGAIFQCPLGGALFAASILYREADYETDAMVPAFVASVTGYSTFMPFWGYGEHLLREAHKIGFTHPLELLPFILLGPLCGLTCAVLRYSLTIAERLAESLGRAAWMAPAIGGLLTGALACMLPQVMDGQYVFIQHALDGTFEGGFGNHSWMTWALLFGAVALVKCLATACTVGSGAPGGVLGPSVFIGGVLGAFVGALVTAAGPDWLTSDPENLRRALIPVGMAGVLSATMRVPLASLVMVAEMTGSYGLIVPLMVVCVLSYIVGRRWGLNDEQVPTSAQSPAHAGDFIVHMLERWTVGELCQRAWPHRVGRDATLADLASHLAPGVRPAIVVTDGDRVAGLISMDELRGLIDGDVPQELLIAEDLMNVDPPVLREDDSLYTAVSELSRSGQLALPVLSVAMPNRMIGMILRSDIHRLIRDQLDDMSKHLMSEHTGLVAMEQESDMHRLAVGVSPGSVDRIQRLIVPIQAIGKSLREADFRRNFGVQVIAIEQSDGSIQCPPDADAPLDTDLRLLAVSSDEQDEA